MTHMSRQRPRSNTGPSEHAHVNTCRQQWCFDAHLLRPGICTVMYLQRIPWIGPDLVHQLQKHETSSAASTSLTVIPQFPQSTSCFFEYQPGFNNFALSVEVQLLPSNLLLSLRLTSLTSRHSQLDQERYFAQEKL